MTDWPTYETDEPPQSVATPQPVATAGKRRNRSAVPSWMGVAVATCIGLMVVMMVVAIGSATQLLEARADLAQLRGEVSGLRQDLASTKAQLAGDETKLHLVEDTVGGLATKQTELTSRMQEVEDEWQYQQSVPNLNWNFDKVPQIGGVH